MIEGIDLSVTCTVTKGNPSSTIVFWTKVDNSVFRYNGSTLQLPNIQRNSSGTYKCTAENSYSNGKKGTDSQFTVVNVQCRSLMSNTQSCNYFVHVFFTSLKRFFSYDIYIYLSVSVWFVFFCDQLSIITQVTFKCH